MTQITSSKLQREVCSLFPTARCFSFNIPFQLFKRDLTLVDKSGFSVRMTLWGKQAEQYSVSEPSPVIAFKGVKVGDFGGKFLSQLFLTRVLTMICII